MPKRSADELLERILLELVVEEGCPHRHMLDRVALLLTAAALRHGGVLELSDAELTRAQQYMLALTPIVSTRTILVQALPEAPEVKQPTHPAPEGRQ